MSSRSREARSRPGGGAWPRGGPGQARDRPIRARAPAGSPGRPHRGQPPACVRGPRRRWPQAGRISPRRPAPQAGCTRVTTLPGRPPVRGPVLAPRGTAGAGNQGRGQPLAQAFRDRGPGLRRVSPGCLAAPGTPGTPANSPGPAACGGLALSRGTEAAGNHRAPARRGRRRRGRQSHAPAARVAGPAGPGRSMCPLAMPVARSCRTGSHPIMGHASHARHRVWRARPASPPGGGGPARVWRASRKPASDRLSPGRPPSRPPSRS